MSHHRIEVVGGGGEEEEEEQEEKSICGCERVGWDDDM